MSESCACDRRRCEGCGKTLSECYDMPWYKGTPRCCPKCSHPSRETLARRQRDEDDLKALLDRLTPRELSLLRGKLGEDVDG